MPSIEFGRIAAQTAKQVIVQKVREAERDRQYQEFKDRIGDIVNGIVKRVEYGSVIVDLAAESGGNCEATRPGQTHDVGVAELGLEQQGDRAPSSPIPGAPTPVIEVFRHDQSFTRLR